MVLTILLIVLGIALAVVFINRDKDEEKARLAIIGLTAGIVVLAIASLLGFGRGGSTFPQFDVTADRGIGEAAADRIAGAAKGRRVVIIADPNAHHPIFRARTEAFRDRLLTHGMEVLGIASPWPSTVSPSEIPEEGISAIAVEEALREHPDAEVLVSLVGFPLYGFERVAQRVSALEFFVLDEFPYYEWQPYIAQGIVKGLFLQPMDSDWQDTSGSGEDIFNRRYIFVTRENFNEVRHRFDTPGY